MGEELIDRDILEYFKREIFWQKRDDVEFPYITTLEDKEMKIQLNDFPQESMYSLVIDEKVVCDFDDWPINWYRD